MNLIKTMRNKLARLIATSDYLFNSDMSLVIDRQVLKIEEQAAEIKRLEAESSFFMGEYLCALDVPNEIHQQFVEFLAKAKGDFIRTSK